MERETEKLSRFLVQIRKKTIRRNVSIDFFFSKIAIVYFSISLNENMSDLLIYSGPKVEEKPNHKF